MFTQHKVIRQGQGCDWAPTQSGDASSAFCHQLEENNTSGLGDEKPGSIGFFSLHQICIRDIRLQTECHYHHKSEPSYRDTLWVVLWNCLKLCSSILVKICLISDPLTELRNLNPKHDLKFINVLLWNSLTVTSVLDRSTCILCQKKQTTGKLSLFLRSVVKSWYHNKAKDSIFHIRSFNSGLNIIYIKKT